jgi:hypothetical membrane protein
MNNQIIILPKQQRAALLQVAGIGGILFSFIALVVFSYCIYQNSWFDWFEHTLSHMGMMGSQTVLFNVGLVLMGFCGTLFGLGYWYVSSDKVAAFMFFIGSFLFIFVGFFPLSFYYAHALFVAGALILSFSAILHLSVYSRRPERKTFEYKLPSFIIAASVFAVLSFIPWLIVGSAALTEVIYFIAISLIVIPSSLQMLQDEVNVWEK